jgi:hypothetical protein
MRRVGYRLIENLHTLYPAAYPRPGKREVNLRRAGALAYSLKTTWFKPLTEVIFKRKIISLPPLEVVYRISVTYPALVAHQSLGSSVDLCESSAIEKA